MLRVPARAVHRPPNPPVLPALRVRARFRQHGRHPGRPAVHGQVWPPGPAPTGPLPAALRPVKRRRERGPHRPRILKPGKVGLCLIASLSLKTKGSCLGGGGGFEDRGRPDSEK